METPRFITCGRSSHAHSPRFPLPLLVGFVLLVLAACSGLAFASESGGRSRGGFGGSRGINPFQRQQIMEDYSQQERDLQRKTQELEQALREMDRPRGGTTSGSPSGSTGKKTQGKSTPQVQKPVQPTYSGPLPRADELGKGKTTYTYKPGSPPGPETYKPGYPAGPEVSARVRIRERRPGPLKPLTGWKPGQPDPNWRAKESLPRADTLGKGSGPSKPRMVGEEGRMGRVPPAGTSPSMTTTATGQGTMPGQTAGVQPRPGMGPGRQPGVGTLPVAPPIIVGGVPGVMPGWGPGGGASPTSATTQSASTGQEPSFSVTPAEASDRGRSDGSVGGNTSAVPDASQWKPTTDWQVRIAWSASAGLGPLGVSKVVIDLRPVVPVPDMPGHWIHDTKKGPEARLTFGSGGLEGPSLDVGLQMSPSGWQKIKTQRPVIPHDFEGPGSMTSGAGFKAMGVGGSFGTAVKFPNVKFAGDAAWGKDGDGLWLEQPGLSSTTGLGAETGAGTGAVHTGMWMFE